MERGISGMGGIDIQRKIDRRRAVNWGGDYGKKPVGITQSKNDKGRWEDERGGSSSSSRIFWEHGLTATGRFI